jgi:hypothetical protein
MVSGVHPGSMEGDMSQTHNGATMMSNGGTRREGWTGLINSMIGFTNAVAMFSLQQVENAAMMITDSRRSVNRFKCAIDSLSGAMEREMDSDNRSTTEQMNRATMVSTDEPSLGAETLAGRKR